MNSGDRVIELRDAPGAVLGSYRLVPLVQIIAEVFFHLIGVNQVIVVADADIAFLVPSRRTVSVQPGFAGQFTKGAVFFPEAVFPVHRHAFSVHAEITDLGFHAAAVIFPLNGAIAFGPDDRTALAVKVLFLDDAVVMVIGEQGIRHAARILAVFVRHAHDIGPGCIVLGNQLAAAVAVDRHSRTAQLVHEVLLTDPSAFRIGDIVGSVARHVVDGPLEFIQEFLADQAAFVVKVPADGSIIGANRNHADRQGVVKAFRQLIAQLIIGVLCISVAQRCVRQVAADIVVGFFRHVAQTVQGRGLFGVALLIGAGLPGLVKIADGGFAAGQVVGIADLGIEPRVRSDVPQLIVILDGEHPAVRVDLPLQTGILAAGMDGRLALGIQQTLFDAVVPGVIRKQDLAVAFSAPGQISLLVVVGTADQVVPVVIGIADGAVAGGQHHGLAALIQVFSQNDALPVIPGIALGGVA